ncbi:MAG: dihydroxy-acid dehydratase, partial [Alphaproteobacteria bacterium]|nr:dihydroxy-acid dehydratase [Alphaproteobacteria bacterium]MBU1756256.1 dihydroxy-acid dehydratase [Alphaproteobacteria bacterium]
DALVDETEISRRLAQEPAPPTPASQTPWEELYREKTGQLGEGGVMDFALKYRGTAQKGLPRHNH